MSMQPHVKCPNNHINTDIKEKQMYKNILNLLKKTLNLCKTEFLHAHYCLHLLMNYMQVLTLGLKLKHSIMNIFIRFLKDAIV